MLIYLIALIPLALVMPVELTPDLGTQLLPTHLS